MRRYVEVWALLFAAGCSVPAAVAASGVLVYSQPTNEFSAYISQNSSVVNPDPGGVIRLPATAYDNFTLAVDTSINEITWVGEFVYGTPSVSYFTLQIYTDNAGIPGTSIFSTIVTNYNQTPLGLGLDGYPIASYDATGFSTPKLTAGTKYWLSIVATTPSAPPYWDWEFGTGGDGRFYYIDAGPGGYSTFIPSDLAFALYAPAVPLYNVCLLYDPTKAVKSGATIPIKLQLCDASGNDLSSSTITVHAKSVTQISTMISGAVEDAGNANPDNDFRFDPTLGPTGGYIFNLKTTGLATGTYNLNFTVTGDSSAYAVPFQVK